MAVRSDVEHPVHHIVLAEYRHAIEEAGVRLDRLTRQVAETTSAWSMAQIVQLTRRCAASP